jgi:uncharacterized membrane protein
MTAFVGILPFSAVSSGASYHLATDARREGMRQGSRTRRVRADRGARGGEDMSVTESGIDDARVRSLRNWTTLVYALHTFSLLTGILGAATIVGAFLTGWPSIIAVILNYAKRREARGTWLESHFRWQIRTFWFGMLWVGLCLTFIVLTLGIGIVIAWLPLLFITVWFIYRIARGWRRLSGNRTMYS